MSKTFNDNARGIRPAPHPYLVGLVASVSGMARRAGAIIMDHYGRDYDIEIKDDASPVTTADKKASEYLVASLSRMTPNYAVVSEENDAMPGGMGAHTYWAIDPLDGTKEFIDRTSGFCVKIALVQDFRPVLGVIYCPAQDVLYTGVEHGPAFRTKGTNAPQPIHTRMTAAGGKLAGEKLSVLFNRKHADPALYREARLALKEQGIILPVQPKIRPGLPRSMQIAEGLADIHAGTGGKNGAGYVWDVAADDVILTNAGGALFALKTGERLDYSQPRRVVPAYLAVGHDGLRTKPF